MITIALALIAEFFTVTISREVPLKIPKTNIKSDAIYKKV
jgi:hypothetical protein